MMVTTHAARAVLNDVLGDIAPEVDLAHLDPDAPLNVQIDLDSMDVVTLMERLGERSGIAIPDKDASKLRSINDIVGYLVEHADAGGATR